MFYVNKLYICIKQKLDGVVYFIGCTKYLLYFILVDALDTSVVVITLVDVKRHYSSVCCSWFALRLTSTLEKLKLIMFDEDHNIIYSDRN